MATLNVTVGELTCGACAKLVAMKIQKIEGVSRVIVEVDGSTTITVEDNHQICKKDIQEALAGTDYSVS